MCCILLSLNGHIEMEVNKLHFYFSVQVFNYFPFIYSFTISLIIINSQNLLQFLHSAQFGKTWFNVSYVNIISFLLLFYINMVS